MNTTHVNAVPYTLCITYLSELSYLEVKIWGYFLRQTETNMAYDLYENISSRGQWPPEKAKVSVLSSHPGTNIFSVDFDK